jgi:DNA-binding transcriptional MerR regulator
MSIGEFAVKTRLSPKALRLYDQLGLLVPVRIDPSSGYRFYEESPLDVARLVASLRQLEVPLAEIKVILGLESAARARHIRAYWAVAEGNHAARRELATYLVNQLSGKRSDMIEVVTKEMPERYALCLKRYASSEEDVWRLGKDFIGIMRERLMPRTEGSAGASFLIYHGEVSADSDGPVEWCRPIPTDGRDELARHYPELSLRSEPAHEEAWVHLGPGGQVPAAQWNLVSETIRTWAAEQGRFSSALGVRVIFEFSGQGTADPATDCSFSVPLS